jgi:hypothetical protein
MKLYEGVNFAAKMLNIMRELIIIARKKSAKATALFLAKLATTGFLIRFNWLTHIKKVLRLVQYYSKLFLALSNFLNIVLIHLNSIMPGSLYYFNL